MYGHHALGLVPQTPARAAERFPTRPWAAIYSSSAPCVHSPFPPVSCQQSLRSPIPSLQERKLGPQTAVKAVENWSWKGFRLLLICPYLVAAPDTLMTRADWLEAKDQFYSAASSVVRLVFARMPIILGDQSSAGSNLLIWGRRDWSENYWTGFSSGLVLTPRLPGKAPTVSKAIKPLS